MGDNKIVDFELYGDRGCAISPANFSRDYSLTLRKHKEDHIILDQILEGGIMNEEMSDFGILIDGEMNIIYAGLTGSGKTTTIRALIDYYVSKMVKECLFVKILKNYSKMTILLSWFRLNQINPMAHTSS